MDNQPLRNKPVFFSRLGFCYDPPRADENGEPLVLENNYPKYARLHDQFADVGVAIHTGIIHSGWVGVDTYDYSLCDKTLEMLFASGKVSYYLPRVKLNAPVDWCAKYPEDVWVYDNGPRDAAGIRALVDTPQHDWLGYHSPEGYYNANGRKDDRPNVGGLISLQSFSSAQWLEDAGEALRRFVRHLEDGPYADRILGYHIAYGASGESMPWGRLSDWYGDFGVHNRQNFRQWGLKKYGSEAALRAAWGDFGEDGIPPMAIAEPCDYVDLTTQSATWGRDYMRYCSETNVAALAHFGKVAKAASGGKLVGAFYGYIMDMPRAPYAGHCGWEQALDCPDLDFFCAPKSYWQSGPGDPGGEMGPARSVNRRKLWVDECDNRTHLANEASQHPAGDAAETYAVHWREWCKNLSHDSGLWFMDLGGGWYDDDGIIQNIETILRGNDRLRQIAHEDTAQILHVLDEESHIVTPTAVLSDLTGAQRNFQRAGAPIDNVLFDDLFHIPLDGVRLLLMPYSYGIDTERLARLRAVVPPTCTVVWLGQPSPALVPTQQDVLLPLPVSVEVARQTVEAAGVHTFAPTGCAVYADNRLVSFFPNEAMNFTADLGDEYTVYDLRSERSLGKTRYLTLSISAKDCAAFAIQK